MAKLLPVPSELEHLVEKREGGDRRKTDPPPDGSHREAVQDSEQPPTEQRSGANRRKN